MLLSYKNCPHMDILPARPAGSHIHTELVPSTFSPFPFFSSRTQHWTICLSNCLMQMFSLYSIYKFLFFFFSCGEQKLLSSCSAWNSLAAVFLWLPSTGSRAQAQQLVHRYGCPSTRGIFPDQGSTLSPAWASGFLATGPPGKSRM